MEQAKDLKDDSVPGSVHPNESKQEPLLGKGIVGSVQQGFDATAETVGQYDSAFIPKTVKATEQTFKSSATAKPSLVSKQTGVSFQVFFLSLFYIKLNV